MGTMLSRTSLWRRWLFRNRRRLGPHQGLQRPRVVRTGASCPHLQCLLTRHTNAPLQLNQMGGTVPTSMSAVATRDRPQDGLAKKPFGTEASSSVEAAGAGVVGGSSENEDTTLVGVVRGLL